MQQQEVTYDYDAIGAGYYDDVYRRNAGAQSKWHHTKFSHVHRQIPADCESLLDIGCGPGTFIGSLPSGLRALGVDVADAQIQYARREYGTDRHVFQCVTPGPFPFDDASFDVVTMVELIEHLPVTEVDTLLGEARRILRPGGKLIVTTPNYASGWPLLEKIVNARLPVTYEEQHITRFRPGSLRGLLTDKGYTNVRVTTFQGIAPFTAALNWKLADWVQNIENPLLSVAMGFLLLGVGYKP